MATIKCTKCGTKIENVTSGIIVCSHCGHKMKYVPKNSNIDNQSRDNVSDTKKNKKILRGTSNQKVNKTNNGVKETTSGCITFIVILIIVVILGKGCNGNNKDKEPTDEKKVDANGWTLDDYGTFSSITKQISDEFVANYKAPWGLETDWKFAKFDDEGRVVVTTKYSFKNINEKQMVMCVFSPKDGDGDGSTDSFDAHYLSIGNTVYLDDGTCDEFFESLQEISNYLEQ